MGERVYAVKVALDPTPAQERLLASHAGAARLVFNRMLAEVKSTLDARTWERRLLAGPLTQVQGWSLAALRRTWNANKDVWAPWWYQVSKEAFNHGFDPPWFDHARQLRDLIGQLEALSLHIYERDQTPP